jgi:hypothetical protein
MKLNQLIALVGGRKAAVQKLLTKVHHGWKEDRFLGINRTYQPKNEDGDKFNPETRLIQLRAVDELKKVMEELSDFWNLVASQEKTNTQASSDVVVDGQVLLKAAPVTVLLFLEKQLTDLLTLVNNVPILSNDRVWKEDADNRCYVSQPEQTVKTRKEQTPLVKYHATKEFPAQTELVTSDVTIGWWTTVHMSGAIPESTRHDMAKRIEKVREAVKVAREEANCVNIVDMKIGQKLLSYIFEK